MVDIIGTKYDVNVVEPDVEKILAESTYNPLDRFMIFCGSQFYPCGGMDDFLSSHPTLDDAKEALLKHALAGNSADWAHIYDAHESKKIWAHDRYA